MEVKAHVDSGTANLADESVGKTWVNTLLNHAYGRTESQPIKDAIDRKRASGLPWQQILQAILAVLASILGGNPPPPADVAAQVDSAH